MYVLGIYLNVMTKLFLKDLENQNKKNFIFSRKTQSEWKQRLSLGAGAFRHVSKPSFVCVFK